MKLHSTSHPRIEFAKGDIFAEDAGFDGILVFTGGFTGLHALAEESVRKGLPYPYRIHGIERPVQVIRDCNVRRVVQEDLDYLASQGCRRIGVHAPNDMRGAKSAIRAAIDWLKDYPGAVDQLVFVDSRDDYYNYFGLDSFKEDRGIFNPSPTEFESFFENDFEKVLVSAFGQPCESDGVRTFYVMKNDVSDKVSAQVTTPNVFSVSLFYATLLPQVITKVSGDQQDMDDFSRVSQLPRIHRFMGADMAPYTILADTGLLPCDENDRADWFRLALEEAPYFERVLKHYIIGGIQPVRRASNLRLARLDNAKISAMCQEFRKYLDNLETSLSNGSSMPNRYI